MEETVREKLKSSVDKWGRGSTRTIQDKCDTIVVTSVDKRDDERGNDIEDP